MDRQALIRDAFMDGMSECDYGSSWIPAADMATRLRDTGEYADSLISDIVAAYVRGWEHARNNP